jgi:membrane-associated phospholipid phosphatase
MFFMGLFFWGYFGVLRHPLFATTTMPLIWLDEWIPFTPLAFPAYVSLWVYASLAPALLANFRALAIFGTWMAALCLFALGIFWLFPTAVPAAGIDWSLYPQMAIIKDADASGNACPSLHVAAAVFSAFWLDRVFTTIGAPAILRGLSGLYCMAILWSTVATRQHVTLDVLAGTLVGTLFAVSSLRHALPAGGGQEI